MLWYSSIIITADMRTLMVIEVVKREAEAAAAGSPVARLPGTLSAPPGSLWAPKDPKDDEGRSLQKRNAQVGKGRPPGARTLNPRIKSPLLCQLS